MIKERLLAYLDRKLTEREEDRFHAITMDCLQSLTANAVTAATAAGLVEDGDFTSLGDTLMDAHFHGYRGVTVPSPAIYPEFQLFKTHVYDLLPSGLVPFFDGPAGQDQVNCLSIYLLADLFEPKLRGLGLSSIVSKRVSSIIHMDAAGSGQFDRVAIDSRKLVIEFANQILPHLTLYGYSVFRASLPAYAQDTIPSIKTFIRLRGIK